MSANLKYRPIIKTKDKYLSDKIKFAFRDKYNLEQQQNVTLSSDDFIYLQGFKDGANDPEIDKQIDSLLADIEKYGEVEVWLEY